jgi:sugar phosphate isomerase/epimerase
MKLGLVSYNLAKDWDIPTIIKNCEETGFEGVELRTTHAHGVEIELSKTQREEVKKQFADTPVEIAGLGSAFEYHSADPAELRRNIDGTKEYAILAADVGAPGIKVRPNGVPEGADVDKTMEQIGLALRECGEFAQGHGIEVRLEVHGPAEYTSHIPTYRKIIDAANHPNVKVCWNSNQQDRLPDGTIGENFDLLKADIGLCHITDLSNTTYPWRDLFSRLQGINYQGFCLAEVPESCESTRFMKMYRVLFDELCRA